MGRAAQTASEDCDRPRPSETKVTQKAEETWKQRADEQGSATPKKVEETDFDWPKTRKKCEETECNRRRTAIGGSANLWRRHA